MERTGWISKTIIVATLLSGIGMSVLKIQNPYSYWQDELYSITASNSSPFQLLKLILIDVHPPLYQFALKAWILIFGDNEVATRTLSLSCALLTLFLMHRQLRHSNKLIALAATAFLANSPNFVYYANEARPYAMLMLFATICTTRIPKDGESPSTSLLIFCTLLSLTHYFGLIYSGTILAILTLKNRNSPKDIFRIFTTGAFCLIWPIFHITNGSVIGKTGGKFWIKNNGLTDTIQIAANGLTPTLGLYGLLAIIAIATWSMLTYRQKSGHSTIKKYASATNDLAWIVILFIAIIAIIDHWSPISTHRNYITLSPAASILAANFFIYTLDEKKLIKLISVISFSILSLSNIKYTKSWMNEKSSPNQDWKGASNYIIKNHEKNSIYYLDRTGSVSRSWLNSTSIYYLKKISNNKIAANPYEIGKTTINTPALLLVGHAAANANELGKDLIRLRANQVYGEERPSALQSGKVLVFEVK